MPTGGKTGRQNQGVRRSRQKKEEYEPLYKSSASKYKPEYARQLIDLYRRGGSSSQFCRDIQIDYKTFKTWAKVHPDFALAKDIAKEAAKAHYADLANAYLVENTESDKLNTTLFKFIAATRFGWGEKKIKIDGAHKSLTDIANALLKGVSEGIYTPSQIHTVSKLLQESASLEQHEKLASKIEELQQIASENISDRAGQLNEVTEEKG